MHFVWNHTGVRTSEMIPEKFRIPLAALIVIAVMIVGSFVSKEAEDNTRANRAVSLFGLLVLIAVLYATSRSRKDIKWHTVIVGMLVQFVIALFVLRTGAGYDIFSFVSELARDLLGFADQGTSFLTAPSVPLTHWFLVAVIPAIIFFVALVQLLYYNGILQWFIGKFAVFFFWSMRVSGAEAVVAAASPFIGQGESAMLIRPFVAHLTMAELHQIMCSGFATIAGSVLVAYIGLGVNPQALISSCVMSIPASLAVSKLRYPETEETLTAGRVVIPDDDEHRAANSLHAFANGAWLGLKIAGMIVATLLCIISLLGLADGLLTWWGKYLNINHPPLTIELIVGYICYPIAFLLGVPRNGDLFKVSQLIGIKLIAVCALPPPPSPHTPTNPPLTERIRSLHPPPNRPTLRGPLAPLQANRDLRPLRLREHRVARHPDRRAQPDRAGAVGRRVKARGVGVDCRRAEHIDQREYCGLVGYGSGCVFYAY
jgi:concentrative nucleoside transporter, CNT family